MSKLKLIEQFYLKLGTIGLSCLTNKNISSSHLIFLKKHISKSQKILDLACGYGRLTIPLSKQGYNIEGIDIASNLIENAKKNALKENLKIKFKVGNMCDLPYKTNSFDIVFCMWSSFNHLLTKKNQVEAIQEIYRILNPSGVSIIDMPYFRKPTKKILQYGSFVGKSLHLFERKFGNLSTTLYLHNKNTLSGILQKAKICSYKMKFEVVNRKRRLLLYIYKENSG